MTAARPKRSGTRGRSASGSAGIVIDDQGHVIVNGGTIDGGAAVSADAHGHGELRNAAAISPVVATQFAVASDSGGNVAF